MRRNPLGNIFEHKIVRNGKKITVFDVRRRVPVVDAQGNYVRDSRGRRTYKDKTKRVYTRAEAQTAQLNMLSEKVEAKASRTFNDLADYFSKEYVKPAVFVGGRKISGYKQDIETVKRQVAEYRAVFGPFPLDSISYEHIRSYAEKVATTPLKRGSMPTAATINKTLSMLRHIFNIGIQLNWINENPFRRGPALIKKSNETRRGRMLTFAEETALLAACVDKREHLRLFILLSLDTAMRRGEIYDLRWWQIDFDNRVIYIKDGEQNSKTGVAGILPMTDRLRRDLYAIQGHRDELVLGKVDFKRSWKKACEIAKIDGLQFRDLRSTASTRMMLAGNSGDMVRKITRHTEVQTFFNHYTNVDLANTQMIGTRLQEFLDKQAGIIELTADCTADAIG